MVMMKTMRMTSNSSSSWEEKKKKKNMGLLIHIIPPTSSITTTTNEWSQDHQGSDLLPARGRGGGGGGEVVMLKQMKAQHPPGQAPQQDQGLLRCPRCDSSNTKFCYYNNYSLSQPRHFCKSCKRYWTRGGTLRNVPVGGGCRKNKHVKRPSPAVVTSNAPASCASDGNAPAMFSSGNHHELDLSYASLGFSSGIGGNGVGNFIRDFITNLSSNSVVAGYGTSSSFVQTSSIDEIPPSMASPLLTSTIFQDQQKFINSGALGLKEAGGINNSFKPSCPSENVPAVDWFVPQPGQLDEIGLSDLPTSCWSTFTNSVNSSWHHNESGNNTGSSITSLI